MKPGMITKYGCRLVNYFHHFEKPLQTIADIFQPAAPFYCSLFKEATVACAGFPAFTAENLRKDHFVNLLVSPPPTMKAFDAKVLGALACILISTSSHISR